MDETSYCFHFINRFFSQWEEFVDLVKTRRVNQERAEEFRRYYNCLRLSEVMNISMVCWSFLHYIYFHIMCSY